MALHSESTTKDNTDTASPRVHTPPSQRPNKYLNPPTRTARGFRALPERNDVPDQQPACPVRRRLQDSEERQAEGKVRVIKMQVGSAAAKADGDAKTSESNSNEPAIRSAGLVTLSSASPSASPSAPPAASPKDENIAHSQPSTTAPSRPRPGANLTARPMSYYSPQPLPETPYKRLSTYIHLLSTGVTVHFEYGERVSSMLEGLKPSDQDPAEAHTRAQVRELVGRIPAAVEAMRKLEGELEGWLAEGDEEKEEGEGEETKKGEESIQGGDGKDGEKRRGGFWGRGRCERKGEGDLEAAVGDGNVEPDEKDALLREGPSRKPHWIQRVVMRRLGSEVLD